MDPSIPIPSSSSETTKEVPTKCSSPGGSWLGKIRPTLANKDSLIKSGYLTSDKAALERTPKHTLSASNMCGFESRKPSILIQRRGKQKSSRTFINKNRDLQLGSILEKLLITPRPDRAAKVAHDLFLITLRRYMWRNNDREKGTLIVRIKERKTIINLMDERE